MLSLSVLAILQVAFYVAMGEGTPYPFFPLKNDEGTVPYPVLGDTQPIVPDIRPHFVIGPPKDNVGAEYKPNLPLVNNPLTTEYKKNSSSEMFLPSELSFPQWNFGVGLREDGDRVKDHSSSFKPSGLSFSEWSNQLRKIGPSVIECFSHDFIESVKSSKKLRKAFQVRWFNANSLSTFFYNYVFVAHLHVGNPDAEIAAQYVGLAVAVNFNRIVKKKDGLLRIISDVTSNYLFYRGYLNESNVASLSQQYFLLTKRSVYSVKKPSPKENLKAVCSAFVDFFTSLGFRNIYSVNMVIGVFASQLYA